MNPEEAKTKIQALIDTYEKSVSSGQFKKYTEEETKKDFILPLFEALGWEVYGKEVSAEEHIRSSGRVDYGFYLNERPKFYLEAKKLSADLHREDFARQAIRYAWNRGVTWAVLTDFESIKVFNAQVIDKDLGDKLFFEIPHTQYLERFDQLWLLSKEAFEKDLLDKEAEKFGKKLQKISITALLYKDLDRCREILTKTFSVCNPSIPKDLIDEGVQKLLDRLIFLRVAEDRGVEPSTLTVLMREAEAGKHGTQLFKSMVAKFRELGETYDSELFSPHPFEEWDDFGGAVKDVIKILYGKKGYYEYDFKVMPADVLGGVYESYLGHKLSQSKKGLSLGKGINKRKEQGIYYTPAYIVDYIVKKALQPVLDKCRTVEDIKKIRVLDPACGSGSFLVKALEVIHDKYREFCSTEGVFTKLTILNENIYGVDLDPQAVEIARLNLLINSLDERVQLPLLADNIKNGNSLISGTDEELKKYFGPNFRDKKPFNWHEEFPDAFKQGGFDVIIGNPPWGADITADYQYLSEHYPDSTKEKKDTYKTFIDKAIQLLRPRGNLGFIVPNSFLYQPSYEDIKKMVEQYSYEVTNLGEKIFSGVELPCCILILEKSPQKTGSIVDLTQEDRGSLQKILGESNFDEYRKREEEKSKIVKKSDLTFGDVFEIKDAGIQYHRSGIGLSNKGGSDLYERIFCKKSENRFKKTIETWYGKLIGRYYIINETDELFNLDYKNVLLKNESVSFNKEAFKKKEKILWRQTAASPLAVLDTEGRWFRNTIQCGYLRDGYKNKVSLLYALAIFNSKYTDYVYRRMVLETGRVFPQVKIKYLKSLPFIIPQKDTQQNLVRLAIRMLDLNRILTSETKDSDKWKQLKTDIERTDKKIDEEVYKLYDLTEDEVKIIEKETK